jgi:uncharacterized protein (TIGR03067 family)
MKPTSLSMVLVTLVLGGTPERDQEIRGTWRIAKVRSESKLANAFLSLCLVRVTDKELEIRYKDSDVKGFVVLYKVDPKKNPKQIDLVENGNNQRFLGIYEFRDNSLILCIANIPGQGRPASFAQKGAAVLELERAKSKLEKKGLQPR